MGFMLNFVKRYSFVFQIMGYRAEMRRQDQVPSDFEPVGTHWTRKGSMLGTALAVITQRSTYNPVLVAIAAAFGVVGAFFGSMRDRLDIRRWGNGGNDRIQ